MTPNDVHCCVKCEAVFECAGAGCGLGYFGRLCSSCLREGYQMAECPRCKLLVPIHDSKWGCDECVRVRVVA